MPGHGRADRRQSLLDRPILTAVLAAAAGAVVSAGLVLSGALAPAGRTGPARDAAPAFLAAWRTHLLASWSVDEVEQRTTVSGAVIRFRIHEAQRPPDSVYTGGATISARRGFTLIGCATPPGGAHPVCREQATTTTWAQMVAAMVATVRASVAGTGHAYRVVATGPSCYRLVLAVPAARVSRAAPLSTTYCFDPRTWALKSSVVRLPDAVDTITATSLHAQVTDADLALPADATYER